MATTSRSQLYINGKWVDPIRGNKNLAVVNPATEQVICNVSSATEEDVNVAVESARAAFERRGWIIKFFRSKLI
jgi:acyl-CoA reductase-like NAD-dependent aldehyde dehydrogenase